jgi:hypothetical protein
MMHVYVYCYFHMNLCIDRCICMFTFIYNASTRVLCVYVLIACNLKNLCGIAQLHTGYAIVCSEEREHKAFSHVAWPHHGWLGTLQNRCPFKFN